MVVLLGWKECPIDQQYFAKSLSSRNIRFWRLAGADTVLLIVKMLDEAAWSRMYKYSQSLGIEPLVKVNTAEEMAVAINLGSKTIGVNNRNLTSFEVDLDTISRLQQARTKYQGFVFSLCLC
jgi:indole-3-glycerol phosphate synthase